MKLERLKGVGAKKLEVLHSMDLFDTDELLYHFPASFEDRRVPYDFFEDHAGSFEARVIRTNTWHAPGKKQTLTVDAQSGMHRCKLIYFNSPFLQKNFHFQEDYIFYGQGERKNGFTQFIHPAFAPLNKSSEFKRIIARYRLKKGIGQSEFVSFVRQSLELTQSDFFREEDRLAWDLLDFQTSIREMHFPQGDRERYKRAKYRLVFEDFFRYLLANRGLEPIRRTPYELSEEVVRQFLKHIPFRPTQDQIQAIYDVLSDINQPKQMARLIQGDVGSGKSLIGYFGIYCALSAGKQVVYLAPTELLATEQYDRLKEYFPEFRSLLLTSATKKKKEQYTKIFSGEAELIIGTHAVLQEGVQFKDLDFLVIDEQQRFGVEQREALQKKGQGAHLLMLTATPIPRTMSMVLHKNLDVSVIRKKPEGRLPIETRILRETKHEEAYQEIDRAIERGEVAFIIFPLIEESEEMEAQSLEANEQLLKKRFGKKIAFLHGKMSSEEKLLTIGAFRDKQTPVLAATSLVEVGIDVKDATVMVIRNAERFGLSQLHQMRGRIGRNHLPSLCFLLYQGNEAPERLHILVSTQDGYLVAEEDLKLRGPGELLGTRQSGSLDFPVADIFRHQEILAKVDAVMTRDIIEHYAKRQQERMKL